MNNINNECYKFKKYTFNDGLFKNVGATYIIHLENNGRLKSIENQLSLYHPTNIIYIVYNKGYKKCIKEQYIDKAPLDLIDAFYNIFNDAKIKKYENILILEDDFIFNEKINDKKLNISYNIDNFLNTKKHEEFIYYLGCIPYLQSNLLNLNYNNTLYLSTGTHSCIYSTKFINNILNKDKKKIIDWDVYLNFNYKRYIYYIPLCYQIFPETENSKHWSRGGVLLKYIVKFQFFIKQLLRLDKQIEPGYTIMYIFSKVFFILIIILIIYLIIKIFGLFSNKKNIMNKNIMNKNIMNKKLKIKN